MDFVVVPLVFLTVLTVLIMTWIGRWLRDRHRLELQKAILERVSSVKELGEFLTTEQGERFLSSLAPTHFRPHHRSLWSVRIGVFLLTVGVLLMILLHTQFGGSFDDTTPRAPLLGILLLMAAGLGMLLSAAVSFLVARRLGIGNGRSRGSQKDDAV